MNDAVATHGPTLIRSDRVILLGGLVLCVLAAAAHFGGWAPVAAFGVSALAITSLAALVGRSVEQLGDRFGPGATGVLQAAFGNLPELFICIFALRAGLVDVVKHALVGSILANLLLVLGLAFFVGGLRHGPQDLGSARARTITVLLLLSVTAMVIPSLATAIHAKAETHSAAFSAVVAVVLLVLFALSLPDALRRDAPAAPAGGDQAEVAQPHGEAPRWPLPLAVGLLGVAAGLAASVSEWFVGALEPATERLGISNAFAGLVIVAIAGNAVENAVGVQLAAKGNSRYAFSVVLNSPLQVALVLAPVLVLVSQIFGMATLTLVFSPMLVAALLLSVILAGFISFDGESTWLEGATLVALYAIIAASFWWG